MKHHIEKLSHFQCGFCAKSETCGWWSIGDAPEDRHNWFCPWCGKENIKSGDIVLLNTMLHSIPGRGLIIEANQEDHKDFDLTALIDHVVFAEGVRYRVKSIECTSASKIYGMLVVKT